jgi:hypothetical protein
VCRDSREYKLSGRIRERLSNLDALPLLLSPARMRRLHFWLTGVSLLGCLGLAWLYVRQRDENAYLRADLRGRLEADKQNQQQMRDLENKLVAATAVQRGPQSGKNASAPVPPGRSNGSYLSELERDHPEFELLRLKSARRHMLQVYGAGLAGLGLPPAQLARLKDLLAEKTLREADAQSAASEAGLQLGTPGFREAMNQAIGDLDDQITGIVGPGGQSALAESAGVAQTLSAVETGFQPDFVDAGVPLTAEQAQNFAQLLNDKGSRAYQRANNLSSVVDPTTWLSPANEAMLAEAAQILTPAQLEVFKNHMSEEGQRQTLLAPYGVHRAEAISSP